MRPLGTRAEKTREKILEAAEQLFAERGFEATRLVDIADRVGVRRASMDYYFDDKAALYEEVLSRLFGALFTRAAKVFAQPGDLEARVRRMVELWVDFAWERPAIARILMRETADAAPAVRPELRRYTEPFFALVRAAMPSGPEGPGSEAVFDAMQFVSVVAGSTMFFVSALPALDPSLLGAASLDEVKAAHKQRTLELLQRMGAAKRAP